MNGTDEERFWSRVDKSGECWLWLAGKTSAGYGAITIDKTRVLAHRWAYLTCKGDLVDGLVIDHLCGTPLCVRPDHLEQVPQRINVLRGGSPMAQQARQTECKNGHAFTPENTIRDRQGKRRCRTCANEWYRERRARRKASRSTSTTRTVLDDIYRRTGGGAA